MLDGIRRDFLCWCLLSFLLLVALNRPGGPILADRFESSINEKETIKIELETRLLCHGIGFRVESREDEERVGRSIVIVCNTAIERC